MDDFDLDLNDKDNKYNSLSKYLLIGGSVFFILLFIIVTIMVNTSDKSPKKEEISKMVLGEINCIFEIKNAEKEISILGNEYETNADFSIIIDGKKIKNVIREYLFSESGEHLVKFELLYWTNFLTIKKNSEKIRTKISELVG